MLKLVHPIKDSIHLADYIHVFQDKTEQLTIDNIRTQTFKPLSKASLTEISAFLRYRVWLKFGVENTHTDTITLSFNLADYDSVTVYQIRNNQQLIPLTIGTFIKKHPQPEKTIYPSTTTLLVHFPPKSRILFYCRASGYPSDFGIRPIFFNPTAEVNFFWQDLIIAYSWNITFLSILLFVFITSLANYFQLRHKAFLYYCGYIATHFIFFWRGFIANDQFIDWGSHWLLPYYWRTPFAWGWSIFYILFIDSFLETRIHYPKAHRFLRLLFLVFLSAIVTAQILLAIDPYTGYQYIRFTRFFNSFIGLFLFFYMFIVLKDSSLGRYITIGSLCYIVGSIITRFTKSTNNFWDDSLLYNQIGILAELVFFSTGLAYKSRLDAIEKEKLKQDNVQLALEKELDLARIRNEVSQDIHDEIGAGLTKISLTAAYMERLPELNLIDIREKANRLMQEAQQLRYKLKEIVFAINPEYDGFDEMQAYFRDYASDFWTDTHVSLQFNFPKSSLDTPSVSPKVKRNLLHIFVEAQNNAAKYSQATQIDLTLTQLDKYQYLLEIKDNGIGFVPYSHNIHSKGLSGIKQRAKSIQAQLTIDSEHQHGTTIRVQGFL